VVKVPHKTPTRKTHRLLDEAGLPYVRRGENLIYLNPDKTTIESNAEVFREIAKLRLQSG